MIATAPNSVFTQGLRHIMPLTKRCKHAKRYKNGNFWKKQFFDTRLKLSVKFYPCPEFTNKTGKK